MTRISAIAFIFLAGCASRATVPAPDPGTPESSGSGTAQVVEPAGEITDARPVGNVSTEAESGDEMENAAVPGLGFSREQADAGRDSFRANCTACHSTSEFRDRAFKFKWYRRSAGDLFNLISSTMPEDAPASLAGEEYAAIIAYILRLNGFDFVEGAELPPDEELLDELSLDSIRSDGGAAE